MVRIAWPYKSRMTLESEKGRDEYRGTGPEKCRARKSRPVFDSALDDKMRIWNMNWIRHVSHLNGENDRYDS